MRYPLKIYTVPSKSHGTDSHVLYPGLQNQDERPTYAYLLGNHLQQIRSLHTLGLHFLCAFDQHTRWKPASTRRKCSRHCSHRDECVCRHFLDTAWGLCIRCPRWTSSDISLYVVRTIMSIRTDNLGDYSYRLILMVIILYFMFEAYSTNPMIRSPSAMFALLKKAASE
jgi:hypothetical protein